MREFKSHQERVAFARGLGELYLRGLDGEPLDMAERAMLDDATFAIYRMGQQQFLKDTV